MHRQTLELLAKAKGESKSVLALNLDVRGFSKFSLEVDSVETGLYIRKLYAAILERFYPDVGFFKPTGDGLLIVFDLDEGNDEALASTANVLVKSSLDLVKGFPTLLKGDDWLYFPTPERIGIGIARGAACRLVADDLTLDYSGPVLNLASRLMDIARPEGLVLDESFPFALLGKPLRGKFVTDQKVFLRSIAEKFPRTVRYYANWTTISATNRRPLDEVDWREHVDDCTFQHFIDMGPNFVVDLEAEPIDPEQILIQVDCPTKAPRKGADPPLRWEVNPTPSKWTYRNEAGRPRIHLDIKAIADEISAHNVKRTWPIKFWIRYPT